MTFICQTITHVNARAQEIIEFLPEYGEEPDGFHRFVTDVNLIGTDLNGVQQLVERRRAPIDAPDIEVAFEMLDEVTKQTGQAMIHDMQKASANQIIVPGQAQPMIQNGQHNRMKFKP